jgi:predicted ATPase
MMPAETKTKDDRKDRLAMVKDRFFLLTGAFGSGKSTLLQHLQLRGIRGDFEFPPGENAAHLYRYNPDPFIAPAWEQIYCTDDERTLPFPQAREFNNSVRAIYERFGYTLIDLPCVCVEERADFILRHLRAS